MRVLIIGGTGLVGAQTARLMRLKGHEVTLMSRTAAQNGVPAEFPHICHDYINQDAHPSIFDGFDGLVFAAAADPRHVPEGVAPDNFYLHANGERVPSFMAMAKAGGIKAAVYVSSFYARVAPEKIATNAYVRSRHLADQAVLALADDNFKVCVLNAPFILGMVAGVSVAHLQYIINFAAGKMEGMSLVVPQGGTNHISSLSCAEAILGALENGQNGKAYLIGDENLDWKTYFEMFFEALGNPQELGITTDEHPLLPDAIMFCGRNATISYEPENAELNYGQNRIRETIGQVVKALTS